MGIAQPEILIDNADIRCGFLDTSDGLTFWVLGQKADIFGVEKVIHKHLTQKLGAKYHRPLKDIFTFEARGRYTFEGVRYVSTNDYLDGFVLMAEVPQDTLKLREVGQSIVCALETEGNNLPKYRGMAALVCPPKQLDFHDKSLWLELLAKSLWIQLVGYLWAAIFGWLIFRSLWQGPFEFLLFGFGQAWWLLFLLFSVLRKRGETQSNSGYAAVPHLFLQMIPSLVACILLAKFFWWVIALATKQ